MFSSGVGVGEKSGDCGRERDSHCQPAELVVDRKANSGQLITDEGIERWVALFGDASNDKENGSPDPKAKY